MTYNLGDAKIFALRAIIVAVAAIGLLWLAAPAFAQSKPDIAALNARLFAAVRDNDLAAVRSTLTAGADPMAIDANGQTPAGIAVDRGYYPIAHHILGVRNQRQAQNLINRDAELRTATSAPVERGPQQSWRDSAVPGRPTEIPSARVSAPREAVVITPAASTPTPKKAAPNTPTAHRPEPASAKPAPALVNLPHVQDGAPNPFDPRVSEPEAPPVVTVSAPAVPARNVVAEPNAPSGGNAVSRFFNGITGVFGGGS